MGAPPPAPPHADLPASNGAHKKSPPARRAHAAFSAASESRALNGHLIALDEDPYFTFSENAARVVACCQCLQLLAGPRAPLARPLSRAAQQGESLSRVVTLRSVAVRIAPC